MKTGKILTATALAGILALAAQTVKAEHAHPTGSVEAATEKCYGVAKAAMNDCGANAHSCAGHSAMDGDKTEWIMVPAGLCEKLVNGSLTSAPAAEAKPAETPAPALAVETPAAEEPKKD